MVADAGDPLLTYIFLAILGMIAIGGGVGALLLRLSAHWTVKLHVPFGEAFWTMILAWIASTAVGFVIGLVFRGTPATIFSLPIGFFVTSGIISWMLGLQYPKAMLVTVTVWALSLPVVLLLAWLISLKFYV